MSKQGTPAWGVYEDATERLASVHRELVAQEEVCDGFTVKFGTLVPEHFVPNEVRPVRVIEETPKQSDYVLVPSPEHTKMCEDYKAAQASDAEQAGETVTVWRHKQTGATSSMAPGPYFADWWEKVSVPAVPDAPGVESYTVEQIKQAFENHAHEDDWGVKSFYDTGLISALRGEYDEDRRPVPAQPSLEQVIEKASEEWAELLDEHQTRTQYIAAAVRAAFPALGEDA